MVKEFNYPDLDILDSPLMSPFTSFNGLPGSAIAENIFNDPDSWEGNDDGDAGVDADPLAWLVEEIEKFKANSADLYGAFDPTVDNKGNSSLIPRTGEMQLRTGLKGIDRTSKRQQYRKSINSKKFAALPPVHAMPPSPPSSIPPSPPLSIPPPGLEPPSHFPRSQSPASTSTQSSPYLFSRSPAGSRPNSNPGSRSSSISRSESPISTQDISRRDSDTPTRRRRLPSIPLEPSLPPPPPSPKRSSTELPLQQIRPPSTSRTLPSISSPAGPRRRGSRVSSQDSTTRSFSLQHQSALRS